MASIPVSALPSLSSSDDLPERVSSSFPFSEIPPVGTPVTSWALADSLTPLVAGIVSLTNALAEVSRDARLTAEEIAPGLVLLTGLAGLASELLARWHPHEDAAPQEKTAPGAVPSPERKGRP